MTKTEKIEKLDKNMVISVLEGSLTVAESDKFLVKIIERCHYIVTTIWDLQGKLKNLEWWDFDNEGGEGKMGYFDRLRYTYSISYTYEARNSSEVLYRDAFPTFWLHEDFEDRIKGEMEANAVRNKEKIINAMEIHRKKKALIESALSKLTNDEIGAIREMMIESNKHKWMWKR